ncbi:uncharacterized protein [Diadema antillarum]|uniref:uncharacterized protein n=1 Tax=Diadema antillarum TaxID=105358 RepID=UPI003A835D71
MDRGYPASRLTLLCTLLSAVALSTHPTDARKLRRPTSGRYGIDDIDNSPPDLASDAELLRALDFLDRYERAKNRQRSGDEEPLYPGVPAEEYPTYPVQDLNEISQMQDAPMKWEEGDADDDLDMEDLFPPRAEDLETNEVVFARAVLDSFRDYEGEKEKKLFEKILGDVIAERMLEEDEEENIERLLEERVEEKEGIEDLAAIFEPSSDVSSSEVETGGFDPEDIVSLLASQSSSSEPVESVDDIVGGQSQSSADEGEEGVDEDSFLLSEAGLEALDEAEKILQEGLGEGGESDSMPDFDDTSDLTSFLRQGDDSEASEGGNSSEESKKGVLRDVIYRIVEDTLRRKLGESMDVGQSVVSESYTRSSIADEGSSAENEQSIEEDDELLDELVEDILDEVDKLSSKILQKIKGGQEEDEEEGNFSAVESEESQGEEGKEDTSSSDGFFNDRPLDELSNSIPEEVVGQILGEEDVDNGTEDGSESMVSEGEESMTDEELMNVIAEIVPVAQEKLCPVLDYILDDCSVIDGFRGLGSGGYREAFSSPCNRHQLCYTCSHSYGIPTNLCDEIYKAELLTLCNGDAECKQRAKYFWLAATNERTPPNFPLSVCSDKCVLDYLLGD